MNNLAESYQSGALDFSHLAIKFKEVSASGKYQGEKLK